MTSRPAVSGYVLAAGTGLLSAAHQIFKVRVALWEREVCFAH